jgi:hypothetical protein
MMKGMTAVIYVRKEYSDGSSGDRYISRPLERLKGIVTLAAGDSRGKISGKETHWSRSGSKVVYL